MGKSKHPTQRGNCLKFAATLPGGIEQSNYGKARELYEMILSESLKDYVLIFDYICILKETMDYTKMLELLQKMKSTTDEEIKLDRWASFYLKWLF